MTPSVADLSTLSRLLDEALELEPAEVHPWLAALPQEHQHLVPRLRGMLAEHLSGGRAEFMAGAPRLDGPAPAPRDTLAHPGDLVGPYRLVREVGQGGMGSVWLAERADGALKRQVALKLPRLAWGAGLADRMARERDIGALLEHPHIGRLYDAGVDALGRPYLALEYIDGQAIDSWCDAHDFSVRQRLTLLLQVVRAVAYAHGRLVVHRDLKPSNVLVTGDGQAHLLDFGIAKLLHEAGNAPLTQERSRVWTPHYASPEQIRGEAITVASDVYSLGVLLYVLLTGQLPHAQANRSLAEIEQATLDDEAPAASSRARDQATARALRGELDAILAKALQREPGRRYATADALAEDIERHLAGERVLAQPDSLGYRLHKLVRRHRVGVAATAAITLAVLGGAGASIVQARRATEAAERARVVKEFVVDVFRVNAPGGPANGELRQLPAEMLLERGGQLIETRFAGQPRLQAELYGVVGEIFADMGAKEPALDYSKRAVKALAAISAAHGEQGRAALLLARTMLSMGRVRDAEAQARRAILLLEGDPTHAPRAHVLLASVLQSVGKIDAALGELQKAESQLERAGAGPTVAGALAKDLRADILTVKGRFDEAMPLYLSAIEEAVAAEGPASPTATNLRYWLANTLRMFDRIDEAIPLRDAALATWRSLGRSGEIRAALSEAGFVLDMAFIRRQSFADAQATIERASQLLTTVGAGVSERAKANITVMLGLAHLLRGDVAGAAPMIERGVATLRPSVEAPWDQRSLALAQGFLALLAGRHAEADAFFRSMIESARVIYETSPWAAFDYALYATNLSMQGRFDEAEGLLRSLPKLEELQNGKGTGTYLENWIDFTYAQVRMDRGDPAAALKPELLAAARREEGSSFRRWTVGEAACAAGRRAEGLQLLQDGMAAHISLGPHPNDPILANIRAIAGLCALASGDRKLAVEYAALARAAFTAQPGVSPYFKRPAEKLDRLLRGGASAKTGTAPD